MDNDKTMPEQFHEFIAVAAMCPPIMEALMACYPAPSPLPGFGAINGQAMLN